MTLDSMVEILRAYLANRRLYLTKDGGPLTGASETEAITEIVKLVQDATFTESWEETTKEIPERTLAHLRALAA